MQSCPFYNMDPKKSKNSSPRIKIIQKLYNALMNPDALIEYPKSQYKKFIKDVVKGTIERNDLITEELEVNFKEELILSHLDKLFQVIIKCAVFEFLYKPKTSSKIIIKEYLNASNFFLDNSQTKYLNALLDKISRKIRTSDE